MTTPVALITGRSEPARRGRQRGARRRARSRRPRGRRRRAGVAARACAARSAAGAVAQRVDGGVARRSALRARARRPLPQQRRWTGITRKSAIGVDLAGSWRFRIPSGTHALAPSAPCSLRSVLHVRRHGRTARSSGSGRTSRSRKSRRPRSWPRSIPICTTRCSGRATCRSRSRSCSRRSRARTTTRAVEKARASAEYREIGEGADRRHRARFFSGDALRAARPVRARRRRARTAKC